MKIIVTMLFAAVAVLSLSACATTTVTPDPTSTNQGCPSATTVVNGETWITDPKVERTSPIGVNLHWSKVRGAKAYEIYLNGELFDTTTDTSYDTGPVLSYGETYKASVKVIRGK